MNKISLSYPETWLTININVYKLSDETLDNSGVLDEVGSTWIYIYTFTWDGVSDYSYVATCPWYNDIWGTLFHSNDVSVSDIWEAQISDYAWDAGTFANKFDQYGWVSHVIHDSKWAELSVDEKRLIEENKKLMEEIKSKLLSLLRK